MKKLFLTTAFVLFSLSSYCVSATDYDGLHKYGFNQKDKTCVKIAERIDSILDENIADTCIVRGKKYWANDKKKWGASFHAQKQLLTLALTTGDVFGEKSIARKYLEGISTCLNSGKDDVFAKVMGNLNGLYFYLSCCCYLNEDIKNEYFRRVRHDQIFKTSSVTTFEDYLFSQTDFVVKKLLEDSKFKNVLIKLTEMSKSWFDEVKHDWYCYSVQYKVFGKPLLPVVFPYKVYEYETGVCTSISESSRDFYLYDDEYNKIPSVFTKLSNGLMRDPNKKNFRMEYKPERKISLQIIRRLLEPSFYLCESAKKPVNFERLQYDKTSEIWDEYGIVFKGANSWDFYNFSNYLSILNINIDAIENDYSDSKSYPLSFDYYLEHYNLNKKRDGNYSNEQKELLSEIKTRFECFRKLVEKQLKNRKDIHHDDYINRLYGVVEDAVLHGLYKKSRDSFKKQFNKESPKQFNKKYAAYLNNLERLIGLFPTMYPDYIYDVFAKRSLYQLGNHGSLFVKFITEIYNGLRKESILTSKCFWNLPEICDLLSSVVYCFQHNQWNENNGCTHNCQLREIFTNTKGCEETYNEIDTIKTFQQNHQYKSMKEYKLDQENIARKEELKQKYETTLRDYFLSNIVKEIVNRAKKLQKSEKPYIYKIFKELF